ncbi:MAG: alanine--tRNA ligase [Proteobacteria bacterium]|nr:alanine--tRNA ligase [Pseudomonadota bacterium]
MAITGNEIRKSFIQFFESKGHKHVRSASLVPHNDPTILFTNAGMNQFKDFFLGNQTPEFTRAVSSQKVMRAGGKHNDLENVGRTDRHHTFFEMLGNFSFGDYFKKEAIEYAWEYLTGILGLSEDKLAVSVYLEDQDSYDIWHGNIGIPAERIGRLGEKENFWSMGDTGPCGPCSEIHYQLYPLPDGKTVQKSLEDDDGTFLEVWNLVFMQYNRENDGTLSPLPKPSIDTGMGIERIASVVQNQKTNYETDLLSGLVQKVEKNAPAPKGSPEEIKVSGRVIADHIRATVFLIADGVNPSNEGRGYVLRRIIRRAARHGKELGYQPGFFTDLVDDFVPMMQESYPELVEARDYARILLEQEERRFSSTLNQGMKILDELLDELRSSGQKEAHGEDLFKLYDTYGFPVDLADDVLQDHGFTYDRQAFDQAMEEQRQRAKTAQDTKKVDLKVGQAYLNLLENGLGNRFIGYDLLETQTKILAVLKDGEKVEEIRQGDAVEVLLAETPFYAESGGQVGDSGEVVHDEFRIRINDTQTPVPGLNLSRGEVVGTTREKIEIPDDCPVLAKVSLSNRQAIQSNHTATHLLQAALRNVLGDHVKQSGSLVNAEKLRFDFSHYAPLTKEQLRDVESFINQSVRNNEDVAAAEMSFDEAVESGAMAIFGEKYGDHVRVVTAGASSKELCGGCHTSRSGNIGLVKIVSEESIAAGIRRIEALTGINALEYVQENLEILDEVAQKLKVPMSEVGERIDQMGLQSKEKDKQIERLQEEIQKAGAEKAMSQVKKIGSFDALMMQVDQEADLKSQAAILQKNIQSGIVLLGKTTDNEKISVILSVSKNLSKQLNAGQLIKDLAPIVSGKGGGSPVLAQCGGTNPSAWNEMNEELEKRLLATSQ